MNGRVYIGTRQGFYRPVSETGYQANEKLFHFEPTHLLAHPLEKVDATHVYQDTSRRLWFITPDSIGYATRRYDGAYDYHSWPFRKLAGRNIRSVYVEGQTAWFGGSGVLVRCDLEQGLSTKSPVPLYLTEIRSTEGNDKRQSILHPVIRNIYKSHLKLQPPHASIQFNYAVPVIGSDPQTSYRYWLKGYDEGWSPWSEETGKQYSNIPNGNYRFEVQARTAEGKLSRVRSFAFDVLPAWYKTKWAYLGYILAVIILWYLIDRTRLQILRRRNVHLEEVISERTSQIIRQNSKLEESNTKLQRINTLQKEFMDTVSHDLRNPIGGIQSIAEILMEEIDKGGGDPGELIGRNRQAFGMINDSAHYMNEIITNLLDVSAIESGRVTIQPHRFDLAELLGRVLPGFKNQAERKSIHIEATSPEHCVISADESRVRQVLENLISNAIKYTPPQTEVLVGIYPESTRVKNGVRISVSDEGPGLTTNDKNKLFRKFQKLSASPTGGEKSIGLGLYITRSIVDLHSGQIWVESEEGRGATFNVELPIGDVDAFFEQ